MEIEPGDILRDTHPEPVAGIEGRYCSVIPDAWRIFYAFGGSTMATALRAASAEVGRDDLQLVSTDATFCQAVPCGPVAAQVEVLRNGRSAAQALVRLWALDPDDPDPDGAGGQRPRADGGVRPARRRARSSSSGPAHPRSPAPSCAPHDPRSTRTHRSPGSRTTPRPSSG